MMFGAVVARGFSAYVPGESMFLEACLVLGFVCFLFLCRCGFLVLFLLGGTFFLVFCF